MVIKTKFKNEVERQQYIKQIINSVVFYVPHTTDYHQTTLREEFLGWLKRLKIVNMMKGG